MIDDLDQQRDKLDQQKLKPITKEIFDDWLTKRTLVLEKDRKERIMQELKELGIKNTKGMSGKELFENKQQLFTDMEGAVDEYKRDENVEIDQDAFEDEELPDF